MGSTQNVVTSTAQIPERAPGTRDSDPDHYNSGLMDWRRAIYLRTPSSTFNQERATSRTNSPTYFSSSSPSPPTKPILIGKKLHPCIYRRQLVKLLEGGLKTRGCFFPSWYFFLARTIASLKSRLNQGTGMSCGQPQNELLFLSEYQGKELDATFNGCLPQDKASSP